MLSRSGILITAGALALGSSASTLDKPMDFGPNNPFYAPSTLPFHAPPFDRIKDSDYQPAIEAGMAEQRQEIRAIADNPAPPTFENTLVALEKTGQLFNRAMAAFNGVTGANLNPELQKVQDYEAPRLAAHSDAIYLDSRLFQRVAAIYQQRESLKLDAESLRLVEFYYKKFVHSGANLSDSDKDALKKLNEEESNPHQRFHHQAARGHQGRSLRHHGQGRAGGLDRMRKSARPHWRQRSASSMATWFRCRTPRNSLTWICSTSARPGRHCSRIPGIAPNAAEQRYP